MIRRFVAEVWRFLTMDAREFHDYAMAREEWPTHDEAMNLFHK
jgi:hypothetical protein